MKIVGIAGCSHPLSACFANVEEDSRVETKQVVCFALVDFEATDDGEAAQNVLPMVVDRESEEAIAAFSFENYLGLLFPGEKPSKYTKAATEFLSKPVAEA